MCGILAVAGDSLPSTEEVERMRDALAHRGPDDATLQFIDEWAVLAFRRLSIIDLEGARQPLRGEDEQVLCIFNGEIYNFAELRSRLQALGHRFATAGDGEVIVHGYEQWGDEIFAMLEGMFAVALVDRRRRRLVLARDRFGIKPLFYARRGKTIAAASELKALLPWIGEASASRHALALGSLRMHVPWPYSAFDGVFRLPPGALLEHVADAEPQLRRYAPMATTPPAGAADDDATAAALHAAIRRQMVADVPVGAFLSGGIDSTLIVALMREISSSAIHTFSIATVDHDESEVAAITARELGTTHHRIALDEIKFEDLVELPAMYDEPFAETSALGVRALSRFAREHVKVALSGDGGDEVFGGYGFYRWIRALGAVHAQGHERVEHAAHALLVRRAWSPTVRRLLRAALLVGDSPEAAARDVTSLSWAAPHAIRAASDQLSDRIAAASTIATAKLEPARRAMIADRLERLPNAMLSKVDIASMSAGLEVRVPMLDDALVRHADHLPVQRMLMSLRWGKVVLRRLLERTPARRIAWDKKRGFTLPLDRWLASATIAPRIEQLFGDMESRLYELTGERVTAQWQAFRHGGSRYSAGTAAMQLLWFANVGLWADRFRVRTSRDGEAPATTIV